MSLQNKKIGMFWTDKTKYKTDTDYDFTEFHRTTSRGPTSIIHFFVWDTFFKPIEEKEDFVKFLKVLKSEGVKYVCQTDFSCWFHYDEQRRKNIIKNFEYHDLIIEHGFECILNFNTIFQDHFKLYKEKLLPYYEGIVLDFNHPENDYIEEEAQTFKNLLQLTSFGNVFLITGKRNESIKKRYSTIINECINNNIKITILPTAMVLLRVKSDRYYTMMTINGKSRLIKNKDIKNGTK